MEQVMLDMIPTGAKAVCHVSQYDIGRTIRFNLRSGGAAYTLSGTETVKVYIKKPDGTTAERNIANTSSTYVDWVTGEGDCDQAGKCECELVITSGTTVIGSKNFTVKIEEDPYNEQGVVTETAGPAIIATFTTNVVDILQEVKCSINPIQSGSGTPYPAGGGRNLFGVQSRVNTSVAQVVYTSDEDYFYLNGTKSGGGYADMANATITLGAGTYYLKAFVISGTASGTVSLYAFDGSDNISSDILGGEKTMTLSATTTFRFRFAIWQDGTVCNNYKVGIVVSKTSNIDRYYTYSNVRPISGFTELNILQTGVNLFDALTWLTLGFNSRFYSVSSSQEITIMDNDVSGIGNRLFNVVPNATYSYMSTFPNAIRIFNSDGETISQLTSGTFTAPADGRIAIKFYANSYPTTGKFILVLGSTIPTEYSEYTGKLIKLEFDDTVYLAEVSCLNGVWKLKLLGAEVDLGDLTWRKWGTTGEHWRFAAPLEDAKYADTTQTVPDILCTDYEPSTPSATYAGTQGITLGHNVHECLVCDERYSDAVSFKAAVSGVKLVYPLETPTEITLDETEQFEALLGVNNVWHDGNGNTEVKYLYNA